LFIENQKFMNDNNKNLFSFLTEIEQKKLNIFDELKQKEIITLFKKWEKINQSEEDFFNKKRYKRKRKKNFKMKLRY